MSKTIYPPPTSSITFRTEAAQLRCLLAKHVRSDREAPPRAKDHVVSLDQIAARLSITREMLDDLIRCGKIPPPPRPRHRGDGYDRIVARALKDVADRKSGAE